MVVFHRDEELIRGKMSVELERRVENFESFGGDPVVPSLKKVAEQLVCLVVFQCVYKLFRFDLHKNKGCPGDIQIIFLTVIHITGFTGFGVNIMPPIPYFKCCEKK